MVDLTYDILIRSFNLPFERNSWLSWSYWNWQICEFDLIAENIFIVNSFIVRPRTYLEYAQEPSFREDKEADVCKNFCLEFICQFDLLLFPHVDDEDFIGPAHGYEELIVSGHEKLLNSNIFQILFEDVSTFVGVEDATLRRLLLAENNIGMVKG